MHVGVTGASGFLGGHLVEHLQVRERACVRAIMRRAGATATGAPAVAHVSDITDEGGLIRAFAGLDAVVHLASRVHCRRERHEEEHYRRVNVDGTRTVMRAAAAAGVRRVIFVSSVSVLPELAAVTDQTSPGPSSTYGASKLAAEEEVQRIAGAAGIAWTVLRPTGIYGPHMKGNVLRLLRLVARGWPIPVPSRPARRSLLFVGNFVQAVAAVLRRDINGCHVLSDADALHTEEIVAIMATSLGARVRTVRIPAALLAAAGWAGDLVDRLVPLPLNSRTVSLFVRPFHVDAMPFWRAAGAPPEFRAEAGFRRTAEWYAGRTQRPEHE